MSAHSIRHWLAFGDFDVAVTCGEFPTRAMAETALADRQANGTAYPGEHVMSGCRNCGGATPAPAILHDSHPDMCDTCFAIAFGESDRPLPVFGLE